MKAILEFDTNDPDQKREFYLASNAEGAFAVIWQLWQYMYKLNKDGREEIPSTEFADMFLQLVEEHMLDLEKY